MPKPTACRDACPALPPGFHPEFFTDLPLADFSIDEIYGRLMDNEEEDKKIEAMLHETGIKKNQEKQTLREVPRKTACPLPKETQKVKEK
jgi:hypothetical protein